MSRNESAAIQREIIQALLVAPTIDASAEIERRVDFLYRYLEQAKARALVLGISGGVDSSVAGRLAQLAVERARGSSGDDGPRFFAVRLPHGRQQDADDARAALAFIRPDETLEVDIEGPTRYMDAALDSAGLSFENENQRDFVLGNVKARQRMIAQYAIAARHHGLVVGTDQAAEAVMGFFTKFGDGAADLTPLFGLNKRQVRAVGRALGAPDAIVEKKPTADLESLRPQRPDEEALGVTYEQIDAFLEGREIERDAERIIVDTYERTRHKRTLPAAPAGISGNTDPHKD
ncbi:ammonia-dependent NAD(+) synthetase [Salinisphaera sp.]|uniref:ammonia-dependent NAD(+) synthetase n=1 Tax=Salinisphaera sp. TaxID=1914330 RepID=UPI002D787D43|nr:ammonia-dependent NAD(+) synthetase [Salinisphaera sp.]HET7312779.1 ammonia-dependent NAD(+) synthetase [Salinisphaera sp.]